MASHLLMALVTKVAAWKQIRALANEAFVVTRDPRHIVRRDDVVRHVAERMGVRLNTEFRIRVRVAMVSGGWIAGENTGKAVFVGVRHRNQTDEQALATSAELRRKEPKA